MAVRETLELDISDALDAVEKFGVRLSEVAAAFGDLLNEALNEALSDLPIITPEVDADPAGQAVSDALDEAVDTDRVVEVDGDADAVTEAGDQAVDAIDATVELDADADAITDEGQSAVDAIDTTIELEVTANTSEAENAIGGLSGSLGGLTDQFGESAGSAGILGAALGAGVGGGGVAGGLKAATSAAGPYGAAIAGAAALTGGAAAALLSLSDAAFENVTTTENFERTLGQVGEQILDLRTGTTGFQTDLRQLAQDMGASDEAVMQAVQSLAVFRTLSGDTGDEVVEFSQDIVALAAQVVAINPEVGTLDEVIRGLERGLITGGRRVQAYGLSFDGVAIKAEAARLGLVDANGEVDRAGLQAAGLSLALQQLPPDYDAVRTAQDRLGISSKATSERFGDLKEELGIPLVRPLADLRRSLVESAEAAGDILIPAMELLGGALGGIANQISNLAKAVGFVTSSIAKADRAQRKLLGNIPLLGDGLRLVTGLFTRNKESVDENASAIDRWGADNVRVAATSASGWTQFVQERQEQLTQDTANAAAWAQAWNDRMSGFVSTVMAGIPSVVAEFQKLGVDGMGVADVLNNLDTMYAATTTWTEQMTEQVALGNDNIVNLMAELGPEKSAIIAGLNAEELTTLEGHLGELANIEQRARVTARTAALLGYAASQGLTKEETDKLVFIYSSALNLEDPTKEQADAIIETIRTMEAPQTMSTVVSDTLLALTSQTPGFRTAGNNLVLGVSQGMDDASPSLMDRARGIGNTLLTLMKSPWQVFSPSRVMAQLGEDIVGGLAVGLEASTRDAVQAARSLVDAVAVPMGDLSVSGSAGVAGQMVNMNVTVPVTVTAGMTPDDGRRVGEAAGQAAGMELRRMYRMEAMLA